MKKIFINKFQYVILFILILIAATGYKTTSENTADVGDVEQPPSSSSDDSAQANDATLISGQGAEFQAEDVTIIVNQAGYCVDCGKRVLFLHNACGETFDVVREDDQEIVYTGRIFDAAAACTDEGSICSGEFTPLTEPGTYYIKTSYAGQSVSFTIAEDTYENLFKGLLADMCDTKFTESAEGVCGVSFGMHILMYSQDVYTRLGNASGGRDIAGQLLEQIDLLLSKQEEAGSLYDDYDATAAFSGVMVMSSEFVGGHDPDLSSACYDAARRAWKWLTQQECDTKEKQMARFYAAVQFFRLENAREYRMIVNEFLKQEQDSYTENKFIFYGALAYLSTEKKTDRDLCARIMQSFVDDTQQMCSEAAADVLLGIGKQTLEEHLSNMLLLSFINDITPSKEYRMIIENIMQYMGGLNEAGQCYIDSSGVWQETGETADRNPEWDGIMLFGIGSLMKK